MIAGKVLTVGNPDEALRVLRAEMERRTVYSWKTQYGDVIPVRDMTDEHLKNTMAMLERAKAHLEIISENAWEVQP